MSCNEMQRAQIAADEMNQEFLGVGGPRPFAGETPAAYVARALEPFKRHSDRWKYVKLAGQTLDVLSIAQAQIRADTAAYSASPASVPRGTLREVISTDRTGRRISNFIGDRNACWAEFTNPPLRITGWNRIEPRHPAEPSRGGRSR